jgi:hypothetical protein
MGVTVWYYAVDAGNEAHPITKKVADRVLAGDYLLSDDLPRRDGHGALIAGVIVHVHDSAAERVERIDLTALPADESAVGQPVSLVGSGVAAGLRMALRRKLARSSVLRERLEEEACTELARRIEAGDFGSMVYRTHWDRLQQAVAFLDGRAEHFH